MWVGGGWRPEATAVKAHHSTPATVVVCHHCRGRNQRLGHGVDPHNGIGPEWPATFGVGHATRLNVGNPAVTSHSSQHARQLARVHLPEGPIRVATSGGTELSQWLHVLAAHPVPHPCRDLAQPVAGRCDHAVEHVLHACVACTDLGSDRPTCSGETTSMSLATFNPGIVVPSFSAACSLFVPDGPAQNTSEVASGPFERQSRRKYRNW